MLLSPEIGNCEEPSLCFGAGATSDALTHGPIARIRSRRGRRTGRMVKRVPQERGRLWQLLEEDRIGATGTANSGVTRRHGVWRRTGTKLRRSKVSPNEGNEVRRNGCQGVAASHSTDEPGEPSRGTLRREGGATSRTVGGKHARYIET